MYVCRVIWVNNKLLAGRKCDISVCAADIFKPWDYLVCGKSVFSYCGIILLTRPDYTFSRRATFSPDAFIITNKPAVKLPVSVLFILLGIFHLYNRDRVGGANGEKWRKMAKNGEKWRWRIRLFHLSNSPFFANFLFWNFTFNPLSDSQSS